MFWLVVLGCVVAVVGGDSRCGLLVVLLVVGVCLVCLFSGVWLVVPDSLCSGSNGCGGGFNSVVIKFKIK